MKPYYVVLLMGAAALGGGMVVRYSDHPVVITMGHTVPPAVVAPPIPPSAHVGPSTSVLVRSAPAPVPAEKANPPAAAQRAEKPSAWSQPVRAARPEVESRIVARVRIPPEPPAVTPLDRSALPAPAPVVPAVPAVKQQAPPPQPVARAAQSPAPAPPTPVAAPPAPAAPSPAPPESNHATLKAGMLISVRISQALSSNLNSPGDVFTGTLDRPLIADGFVIAERGARVRGEVVESKSGGPASELTIRLREILASDGQRVHVVSEPWRKAGSDGSAPRSVYDIALTRGGAAVVRPSTSVTFRLDQSVELTEKR